MDAVSLGLIDTERCLGLGDMGVAERHDKQLGQEGNLVGGIGTVDDIEAMVAYLCSDDVGYIIGQVVW